MSEREARVWGVPVRVAKLPMRAVLRTWTRSGNTGFMKSLVGEDDRIVGFAMIGSEADGVMAVVETAMLGNLPYTLLRDAILMHPTMAEGLKVLFSSVPRRTHDSR
jgi:pyruvate/2-oxoglutarate dehydrogenase complex dihydrolipoamide dehydrogenase (E3) component